MKTLLTTIGSVAFSGWTGAALAALEFAGVRGEKVGWHEVASGYRKPR